MINDLKVNKGFTQIKQEVIKTLKCNEMTLK